LKNWGRIDIKIEGSSAKSNMRQTRIFQSYF
jgi:hypothetical protein